MPKLHSMLIIKLAILLSASLVARSCIHDRVFDQFEFVPLDLIFADPIGFEASKVCSIGYARIGESLSFHESEAAAMNSPFKQAVVAIIRPGSGLSVSKKDQYKRFRFCGVMELQLGCLVGESLDEEDNCSPVKRPIHIELLELDRL